MFSRKNSEISHTLPAVPIFSKSFLQPQKDMKVQWLTGTDVDVELFLQQKTRFYLSITDKSVN